MRSHSADQSLFIHNRANLYKQLKSNSIVVVSSNDVYPTNADGTMTFYQNSDFFYLTGIDQEKSMVILYPDAAQEAQREVLFILETSEHLAIWEGEKLTKEKATELSGIKTVHWVDSFESVLKTIALRADNAYLSTNDHARSVCEVETANDRLIKQMKQSFPLMNVERLSRITYDLRTIKHEEEVKMIKHACSITRKGFLRALEFIKPGVGEWEIEAELICEFVKNKSKGFAYTPIIGSGASACVLHYIENKNIVNDGEVILMDIAAEYGNWQSDLTRSVPANGKFSPRQREVYDAVLRTFKYANSILRPGIIPSDYQKKVIEFTGQELVKLGLIDADEFEKDTENKLVKKYFMHGTSHHIGLDVHDVSLPDTPVAVGNVFTIEPGIYIREENLGIRLENDFYVGESENMDLMADIPIEADDIEAYMAGKRD